MSHCNVNFQAAIAAAAITAAAIAAAVFETLYNMYFFLFFSRDAWVEIGPAIIHLVRNFDGVQAKRARTR